MNTPSLPAACRRDNATTNYPDTAMKTTNRPLARPTLTIGFTVLIERLALLLGRPTRLA